MTDMPHNRDPKLEGVYMICEILYEEAKKLLIFPVCAMIIRVIIALV